MRRWVGRACGLSGFVALLLVSSQVLSAADEEADHPDVVAANAESEGEETAHTEAEHDTSHGDPLDLSHQNASEQLEDPSQFKSDLAIWTFVVFLCLLAILLKFAWRPIMDGLEKRELSIAAMIDEAKQSADKAAEQLREYEARLAAAGEEAQKLMTQAQRDAESVKDEIVAGARAAAQRERERAVQEIESAKNAALQEMTEKSVDLAVLMAGRIVRRQLAPEDHAKLIRDALDQLPSNN